MLDKWKIVIIYCCNRTIPHVLGRYLLLAPSPFIFSSIKLLNHEIINLSLSRRVLEKTEAISTSSHVI
jgi:hypothetical protein